ncbi:hypothetical protein QE436_000289 [Pantoea anthophila]|nr:hypothetical protein [Pantoea anthophila]
MFVVLVNRAKQHGETMQQALEGYDEREPGQQT